MTSLLPGNILYGGPLKFLETFRPRSLGQYFLEQLRLHANKILMIEASTGKEYTGKQIYDPTVCLANGLQNLGIKRGDVVAISSENRFEYVVTVYASLAVNATVTLLNVTYSESEINHALNLSKPRVIFASKQSAEKINKVAKTNSFIEHVILFDSTNKSYGSLVFKDLIENTKIQSPPQTLCDTDNTLEDVAFIMYSSGTTGLPKGVQLTGINIFLGLQPATQVESVRPNELSALSALPWCHIYGFFTLIGAFAGGYKFIYLPKYKEHDFLRAIENYRIQMVFMVPPMILYFAKHPDVKKYNLSSIKVLFCGAAPLGKETEEQIKKRVGGISIRQAYGLTETTRGVIAQNDRNCKPGSVGVLKAGVYAKVVHPDTGNALGANQQGELCFKGHYIMKGYIGDSKSTKTIIKDGWLHTGDIGYFDEDFEFFIVDRIKELIKYKGSQVPPAEIESLLLTNAKIKDAAVIGKPDEEAGELPTAFVVKQENVELTEHEVVKFVADRASSAKRLRGGVLFVKEIPKNPSGKILRRVLRDTLKTTQRSKL